MSSARTTKSPTTDSPSLSKPGVPGAQKQPTVNAAFPPIDSELDDGPSSPLLPSPSVSPSTTTQTSSNWTPNPSPNRERSASLPGSGTEATGKRATGGSDHGLLLQHRPQHLSSGLHQRKGFGSGGGSDGHPHWNRCPLTQAEFLMSYAYHERKTAGVLERTKSAFSGACRCCCTSTCVRETILNHVPILKWLPEYDFKANILGDLIAGITVAVMHIPQGMAYAMLSGLPAVNGLYMAFFPVLVYIIFGTSKHNSLGTFAVVLLMTGSVSQELMAKHGHQIDAHNRTFLPDEHPANLRVASGYTVIQTVALVTFGVGLWEIVMGILRLGALAVVLSDVLVSGFTTGAAVHVLTSQLKGIFGMSVPRQTRFPKLLRTHLYVLDHLSEANVYAVIVCLVTMLVLAVNNELIRPRLAKKCMVPVPIELIAVVGGTLLSYLLDLHGVYKVPVIGNVPTGLPTPDVPPLELLHDCLLGSLVIAIVAYTTSYSMARIFARRQNYVISANQELLALGLSTTVGSFFKCGPVAASLSRSLIQESVGGMTQIASVVSASLILIMLLFLGPYFEPLPTCILSAIIVVSLKGMFTQVADLGKAWQSSKLDALIWISTFSAVVVVDIDIGLAVGVTVSLVTLIWRNQHAYACTLGEIPRTGIYVDSQRFDAAEEIHNMKIFHYGAGLHFANGDYFREVLFESTGLDPVKWHEQAMKRLKKEAKELAKLRRGSSLSSVTAKSSRRTRESREYCERCPILLWNCCTFCSNGGASTPESPEAKEIFGADGKVADSDDSHLEVEEDNSTEIRDIKIDDRSLAGSLITGDCLALPATTGLRLRRTSIHVDTTGHPLPFRYLLIDLSGISFIDMAGVKLFKSLVQDYDRINIQVLFAGPTEPVLHMFRKMSFSEDVPPQRFFPSVHDAVMACKHKMVHHLAQATTAAMSGAMATSSPARLSFGPAITSTSRTVTALKAPLAGRPAMPTLSESEEPLSGESADNMDLVQH